MKIDRLFGILSILLERERVQAKELAQRYEVSVRTIYRDVEVLSRAGMPLVTYPGAGGGIGILSGYKLDKRLLSRQDLALLSAGMAGLSTIAVDKAVETLLSKITPESADALSLESDVVIDFSSWDNSRFLMGRIGDLRAAIAGRNLVELDYLSASSHTSRQVEPYKIVFKANSWYLHAYCLLRGEFRLFKLNRMRAVRVLEEPYTPRPQQHPLLRWEDDGGDGGDGEKVVLRFPPSQEYLVVDLFGEGQYTREADGSLVAAFTTTDLATTMYMLLGFGPHVEVVESRPLKAMLVEWAKKILERYET